MAELGDGSLKAGAPLRTGDGGSCVSESLMHSGCLWPRTEVSKTQEAGDELPGANRGGGREGASLEPGLTPSFLQGCQQAASPSSSTTLCPQQEMTLQQLLIPTHVQENKLNAAVRLSCKRSQVKSSVTSGS